MGTGRGAAPGQSRLPPHRTGRPLPLWGSSPCHRREEEVPPEATQPELPSGPLPFLILGAGVMELPLVLAARPREGTGSLGEDSMPWAPPGEQA